MIVADASAVVTALTGGTASRPARRRLEADDLAAPDIVDIEVASALRGLWLGQKLDVPRLHQAVADLARFRVKRYSSAILVRRAMELRTNLTVYDAAYVALAEALECTLVTLDRRLAAAPGIRCDVEVLSIAQ